jgi:hypothetical protein
MTNAELIDGLRANARWAGVEAYKVSLTLAADRLELYSNAVRLANIALLGVDSDNLSLEPGMESRTEHLADAIEGLKDSNRMLAARAAA